MYINISNTRTLSVAEIEEFLNAPKPVKFSAINKKEAYSWIESILVKLKYWQLKRHQKGIVRKYLKIMTGYSKPQIDRLIKEWRQTGHVVKKQYRRTKFTTIYGRDDIILLAETDKLFGILSGPATKEILWREYEYFGNREYQNLSKISASHIYNLRQDFAYRNIIRTFHHTKPRTVPIAERRRPEPDGKPGFIRVDSVHQGDDSELGKSVYHINFVDEETQWELLACVPVISERYLIPVLERIISSFPFRVLGFHSDNGGEFINYKVADILERLRVKQTKSRSRHTNDNALVETKNGSIVRKEMGYGFIKKEAYELIDEYYRKYFNVFLNYHRPCGYAMVSIDEKGRQRRKYRPDDYMTPYEKLKSLPDAKQYLKPDLSFAMLDRIAYNFSDIEFAREMRTARKALSVKLKKHYLRDSN